MGFTQMHNDYLDPDRAGLNDEQPLALHEDCTLQGYGRRGHGLNGKDADLDSCGQNKVREAWWFSDGTIRISGRRYASIVPLEDWSEDQLDVAQELVCGCGYAGEWDGDCWVLGEDYSIEVKYENDDNASEEENLERAIGVAYDAIVADSTAFETAMSDLNKAFDELGETQ